MAERVDRRAFLAKTAMFGAAIAAGPILEAACTPGTTEYKTEDSEKTLGSESLIPQEFGGTKDAASIIDEEIIPRVGLSIEWFGLTATRANARRYETVSFTLPASDGTFVIQGDRYMGSARTITVFFKKSSDNSRYSFDVVGHKAKVVEGELASQAEANSIMAAMPGSLIDSFNQQAKNHATIRRSASYSRFIPATPTPSNG